MDENYTRERNGHFLEMIGFQEMGGGVEEIVVWCHTCDPSGIDLAKADLRKFSKDEAIQMLNEWACLHSETVVGE